LRKVFLGLMGLPMPLVLFDDTVDDEVAEAGWNVEEKRWNGENEDGFPLVGAGHVVVAHCVTTPPAQAEQEERLGVGGQAQADGRPKGDGHGGQDHRRP